MYKKRFALPKNIAKENSEKVHEKRGTNSIKVSSLLEISEIDDSFDEICSLLDTTPEKIDSCIKLSQQLNSNEDVREKFLNHSREVIGEIIDDFLDFSQEFHSPKIRNKRNNTKKSEDDSKETRKPKNRKLNNSNENEERKSRKIKPQASDLKVSSKKKAPNKINNKAIQKENITSLIKRMETLQKSRDVGLYVQCDTCNKYRYLPDVKDPLDLPDNWYCVLNPDRSHNKCTDAEEILDDEDDLIENSYNAGSLVWAKFSNYPWWPALVEDDPDYETYFWLEGSLKPTQYHVTFFDSCNVTRAWVKASNIKPFKVNKDNSKLTNFHKKFKSRLELAHAQATAAMQLPLFERLMAYSFIKRFTGPLICKKY